MGKRGYPFSYGGLRVFLLSALVDGKVEFTGFLEAREESGKGSIKRDEPDKGKGMNFSPKKMFIREGGEYRIRVLICRV